MLLVFLSKDYIESTNCQLEFRYAVQRGKAFVILRTEPDIVLEQWMLAVIEGFPQYDVYSYEVLGQLISGVPMVCHENVSLEHISICHLLQLD